MQRREQQQQHRRVVVAADVVVCTSVPPGRGFAEFAHQLRTFLCQSTMHRPRFHHILEAREVAPYLSHLERSIDDNIS